MLSPDVVVWSIRKRKRKRTKPYELRWNVGGASQSKSFLTRTLADNFRSDLLQAAKRGELFDTAGGLPASMRELPEEEPQLLWFAFACDYAAKRWPGAAAKSRDSIIDGLSTATIAMATGAAADLDPLDIREAFRWAAIPQSTWVADDGDDAVDAPSDDIALTMTLLTGQTRPVADLGEPFVAKQLWEALAVKVDGRPAARETTLRRRRVTNTALEYAVDLKVLTANPFKGIKRKKVAHAGAVDRRVVANPAQVRELLTALTYVGSWKRARGRRLVAFFATLYYGGMRPAEAVGLRESDCDLPETGWGLLTLAETRPSSRKKYTDNHELHDTRGLKQRDPNDVREVPIPPHLVRILRDHISEFGTGPDGRMFTNERGGVLGSTTYSRAWREARAFALTPRQVASPLVGTAYDLRHAALSTWLNGGVDPTDVAERAGNSVDVLMKRYAKCLDGRHERNNKLIQKALGVEQLSGND